MTQYTPNEVITPTPTDAEHPRMYEHTVYIQGGGVALCIIGIVVLLLAAPESAEIGVPVLGTIAGIGANSLAALLTPRRA